MKFKKYLKYHLRVIATLPIMCLIQIVFSQDLKLDVEGKSRLTGHLDLTIDSGDSTSISIGRGAGINQNLNGRHFNTFTGLRAGLSTVTGGSNTFVGAFSGEHNTSSGNTFVGKYAGFYNEGGEENCFFGMDAGYFNVSGKDNAFFGTYAGENNTTESGNSYFGFATGKSGGENAFFGNNTGRLNTADGNAFFGYRAGFFNTLGVENAFIGKEAGYKNSTGNSNTFLGFEAGRSNSTGSDNTFTGSNAGYNNLTGFENSFFGVEAGLSNIGGNNNAFFGTGAGQHNESGNYNAFFGASAGFSNLTDHNAFFGYQAGFGNTSGEQNTFIGSQAGSANLDGNLNAFFGYRAGKNSIGNHNVFAGAGSGFLNTSGSGNVLIGYTAGELNTTGNFNTMLGHAVEFGSESLHNATAIGAFAQVDSSNSLVLGGIAGINGASSSTNVGIGTTTPAEKLHIAFPSAQVLIGDPGCASQSYAGIGFTSELNCNDYALLGRSDITIVNRPDGGSIAFRENNVNQMIIKPGGVLQLLNLGSGGSTNLCLNASNEISTCSSSLRYKSNVTNYEEGDRILQSLHPVTFSWKNGGMLDLGLIAEEVAEIEPLLVTHNTKGDVEGVKYDRIALILINALKNQKSLISDQKEEIELLRKRLNRIEESLK